MNPFTDSHTQEVAFKPRRRAKAKPSKEQLHYERLIQAGDSPFKAALHVLMSRGKLPWNITVHPEEKLCVDFADALRKASLEGRFIGIWGHVPNEGKRHAITGMILRAMGLIKGGTDYFFIWPMGGGVLEAKTPDGDIKPTQKLYALWCKGTGIKHAYFRSVDDGMDILRQWGAIL